MSNCNIPLPNNIPQDHPYTYRQWECLVENINAFLTCGRNSECGNYPNIDPKASPMWAARPVYDILYQIQPDIMGDTPPKVWSRKFLNSVVETLQAGWPDCEGGETFELITGSIGETIRLDERTRSGYVQYSYVESRTNIGTNSGPHAPPTGWLEGNYSEWYSLTENALVPFAELHEDDFFFTEQEFQLREITTRFPEPANTHNDSLSGILTSDEDPTEESYEALLTLSPHTATITYHSIQSSLWGRTLFFDGGDYFYDVHAPLAPQVAVRTPDTFKDPDGNVHQLAHAAKTLWALRWEYLYMESLRSRGGSDEYWYRENTHMYRGSVYHATSFGRVFFYMQALHMSQWNYAGQTLRTDWGPGLHVPMIGEDPRVSIIARLSDPPCPDDWYY